MMETSSKGKNIDKIPKEKSNELDVSTGSETEMGVMEPSQSLFYENSDKGH